MTFVGSLKWFVDLKQDVCLQMCHTSEKLKMTFCRWRKRMCVIIVHMSCSCFAFY